MSLGAFLAVVVLLALLGGWVVVANDQVPWTTFTLGGDMSWLVPNWGLALGGFAVGALFVLLLYVGKATRARPAGDRKTSEALAALEARLDTMVTQLQRLADRTNAATVSKQEEKVQPSVEDA